MSDLDRIKQLAGVREGAILSENVENQIGDASHQWVENDMSIEQLRGAVWAIFMQYQPEELVRLHRRFKADERRNMQANDYE